MAVLSIKPDAERPSSAMPPYTQYVVMGIVIVLVLSATFWSGHKQPKPQETNLPGGPSSNQLENFQQALQRRRNEEATSGRPRLRRAGSAASPSAVPESASSPVAGMPNSIAAEPANRGQPQVVPPSMTSSFVLRATPTASKETSRSDMETQMIQLLSQPPATNATSQAQPTTRPELRGQAAKPESAADGPQESGRRLPAQEGELFRLYEGTLVRARLANNLDGSFTGPVNSVVAAPVLAQGGSVTLVPAGSRFLGKASRVDAENQTRLAVTFARLILPNGYSIKLDAAPGLDEAGEAGLKGRVDNHNLRKLGLSGAVGLLGGLAIFGNTASPYSAGVASSTGSSATNILNHALNTLPTITVPEGHPVNIYLPGDLLLPAYRP